MPAFFAMVWKPSDPEADYAAKNIARSLEGSSERPLDSAGGTGFLLYDLTGGVNRSRIARLQGDAGAIFGDLFAKRPSAPSDVRINDIGTENSTRVVGANGSPLLTDFWGRWVAFLNGAGAFSVMRDPSSAMPCFYTERSGVTLVFSHLEQCEFLDYGSFSINYDFVRILLAYDRLQNGETGLEGVRELLAGQRLVISTEGSRIEQAWDPRSIARDIFEPDEEDCARHLRETTQRVVRAWAAQYKRVLLNLSGGLDSTIVLNCLNEGAASTEVKAIHHVMNAGDVSELAYAQLAADEAGRTLNRVVLEPSSELPNACEHPLSVRPYRQYLSRGFMTMLGEDLSHDDAAIFSGQGGDHLFRVSRSPLCFADHFHNQGLTLRTGAELLNAARLSGRSVWRIAYESVWPARSRLRKSAMARAVGKKLTTINQNAQSSLDIAAALPEWSREGGSLPPAKFDQVSILPHMYQLHEPFDWFGGSDSVHPLISQPLIELCLRLPTYRLSAGGVNRGLARKAFGGLIPGKIQRRTTKGHASRYFMERISANRELLADTLIDGELMAHGMIERHDVEDFISASHHRTRQSGNMVLAYYSIEAWLRSWKQARSVHHRAP